MTDEFARIGRKSGVATGQALACTQRYRLNNAGYIGTVVPWYCPVPIGTVCTHAACRPSLSHVGVCRERKSTR